MNSLPGRAVGRLASMVYKLPSQAAAWDTRTPNEFWLSLIIFVEIQIKAMNWKTVQYLVEKIVSGKIKQTWQFSGNWAYLRANVRTCNFIMTYDQFCTIKCSCLFFYYLRISSFNTVSNTMFFQGRCKVMMIVDEVSNYHLLYRSIATRMKIYRCLWLICPM